MPTPKTPAIRAAELYKLVFGMEPYKLDHPGWLKLGKLILNLERKFNALKKTK